MARKSFKRALHDRSSGKTRPRKPGGRGKGVKGSPMAHDRGKGAHGGARSSGPGPRGMHTRATRPGRMKGHGGGKSVATPGGHGAGHKGGLGRNMSAGKNMRHEMMSGRGAQGADVNEARLGKMAGTNLDAKKREKRLAGLPI